MFVAAIVAAAVVAITIVTAVDAGQVTDRLVVQTHLLLAYKGQHCGSDVLVVGEKGGE